MSYDMFNEENLSSYHDDTIALNAYKDRKLMVQVTELQDVLTKCAENSKSTRFSIAVVNLQRKLRRFIETFSYHSMKFINEKNKRRLSDPKLSESETKGDIVHQIVKLEEALRECNFRHNDINLTDSIIQLNKKLDKFIPLYSKYADIMGTGPVDKPSSHDNTTELGDN